MCWVLHKCFYSRKGRLMYLVMFGMWDNRVRDKPASGGVRLLGLTSGLSCY